MDMKEIIRTRKSVRTFDGKPLSAEDKTKILNYVGTIANPYNIPVKFVWLDKDKHGLSSPVIVGEDAYIAAKVPKVSHAEEAFGYSFEKMVLYAWSIGIGTSSTSPEVEEFMKGFVETFKTARLEPEIFM